MSIEAIWVISDIAANGTYVTTIEVGDDIVITLNRDQALAYATTVMRAAAYAEYDAAVFAQMQTLGLDERAAAQTVMDLRADRPDLDDEATKPLRFDPLVTAAKKEPAAYVELHGERISQWTMADLRGHAMQVLEVSAGVDLDAAYYRYLIGTIGIGSGRARAAVADIANFRQQPGGAV